MSGEIEEGERIIGGREKKKRIKEEIVVHEVIQ